MAETGSCAACENRRGQYSIGGGLLCETCMSNLSAGERDSERSVTTWYVTENGQMAHRSRDCSALDHTTIVETLSTAEVTEDYVLRRCNMCQYDYVPTLVDA